MMRLKQLLLLPLLLPLLLLVGCPHVNPSPNPMKDWAITVSWSYNFTDVPVCSSSVTVGCLTGFNWGYMAGSTPTQLKTSSSSVCTGSTQPEACSDSVTGLLPINTTGIPFYVTVNYLDSNGNAQVTSPVDSPLVPVPAALPTNVIGAIH